MLHSCRPATCHLSVKNCTRWRVTGVDKPWALKVDECKAEKWECFCLRPTSFTLPMIPIKSTQLENTHYLVVTSIQFTSSLAFSQLNGSYPWLGSSFFRLHFCILAFAKSATRSSQGERALTWTEPLERHLFSASVSWKVVFASKP